MKFLERWRRRMDQVKTAITKTKRVRLTRSILLRDGGEALAGEVRDLPVEMADDLIFWDSAVASDDGITHRTELPERKVEMRRVKLLRSVTLGNAGEVHEVSAAIAYSLISDNSAEPHGWRINPRDFSDY
jgi:hypothetical protein